ncbi:hypothetical protein [Roseibium aggregatum]|uniref:Uncharacterized protein n=1 Tax=Roseibium aggregatum TaxID=187304 RepID=A0A939EGR6_9HYPH|nr:hypothetical protein [Roseibium aggregatum]MBN9672172.1 hypothetical protein [Roseibium aggregatum]
MSAFYHFHWVRKGGGDNLVVVTTLREFKRQDLISIIDRDILSGSPYPDSLIVIAPSDAAVQMKKSLKQMIELEALLRLPATIPVVLVSFDAQGRLSAPRASVLRGTIKLEKEDFENILSAGILCLVKTREAVLVAPHAHHFVHPRRRHSRGFLRAANALIQGEEIGFLALVLLRYLGNADLKIWIDSSSIASLVYAACALKSRLTGSPPSIQIESFSSYDGVDRLSVQDPNGELVLISATASGSLPQKVMEKTRLPDARVITLFSTAKRVVGTVVFDAREIITDLDPLIFEVFEEIQCPWCREGSRTITFVGDQFLADAATITAYTLVQSDASPLLRKTLGRYRGRNAFSLRSDADRAVHRLHVDLSKTLFDRDRREEIRTVIRRYAPASTTHILPSRGTDSETLAGIVADEITALGLKRPEVLNPFQPDDATSDRRGVMVVAASIGSGQSFQDASRDLRNSFKNLPRTYLVGLNKHSVAEHQPILLKDLEHNNTAPKHVLCTVDQMSFPHPNQFSAWKKELEFWRKLRLDLSVTFPSAEVVTTIDKRIEILSREIFGDEFLLPDSHKQPLRLRPSFAFWNEAYGDEITQGDVFATIASILENCRKQAKSRHLSPPLAQSPFHMNVLSSENFTRFNDGIIQGCLLRAAFPHELSFAHAVTANHSAKISHLIIKMLEHHADSQGEACLEFLIALATRRMSLAAADLKRIANHPVENLPDILTVVLPYAVDEVPEDLLDKANISTPS